MYGAISELERAEAACRGCAHALLLAALCTEPRLPPKPPAPLSKDELDQTMTTPVANGTFETSVPGLNIVVSDRWSDFMG